MTVSGVVLFLHPDALPERVRELAHELAAVECASGPDPLRIPACFETEDGQRAEAVLRDLEHVEGIQRVELVFASSDSGRPVS